MQFDADTKATSSSNRHMIRGSRSERQAVASCPRDDGGQALGVALNAKVWTAILPYGTKNVSVPNS